MKLSFVRPISTEYQKIILSRLLNDLNIIVKIN